MVGAAGAAGGEWTVGADGVIVGFTVREVSGGAPPSGGREAAEGGGWLRGCEVGVGCRMRRQPEQRGELQVCYR